MMNNQTEKETKKTIRTFALASFFNDMGSDMIYPIWPLFVTVGLNANMAVLGFIDGLGEAMVSLSQAASGYLSDRFRKRKIFIWTGYLFGSISRVGYALSTHWPQLIPFRVLDRAGKIRGAPRDAIIADVSTQENRGRNFGIMRTMDNLGAVCGILVCIFFFKTLGYRNLFLLAAIPSAIGAGMIFFVVKERKPTDQKLFKGVSFKGLTKDFRLVLILSSFFALGAFSYSFLLIYAKTFGFKVTFIPVLYLIFTFTASLLSLPFGKLSDKIGRKPVLLFSFVLWMLVCCLLIVVQSPWAVVLIFILYGVHKAALETVQKAFVAELAPAEFRASSLGLFQMVIGFCALPSSFAAGMLWDKVGKFLPLYVSIVLTAIACVLLMFVDEKRK
jgi:MFS family permease